MSDLPSVEEKFVGKLEKVIENHLPEEGFGVPQLAEAMGMSRTTLHRKLKKTVKKPASQFLQESRLKRAKELLKHRTGTVSEIAYQVGFGNVSYFITCFRTHFGYPPGDILRSKQNDWPPKGGKEGTGPHSKTIALLPFINDGPDENHDFVAEGLREEIINKLQIIKDIQVISRTTSDTYRHSNKTLKEIASELNAHYILEGSYQNYHNKTRIRLQLIEAATDFHLWSHPYECLLGDDNLFEIQKDVALKVADDLHAYITPEEKIRLKGIGTKNSAAHNHYQNGLSYAMLAKNEKFADYWDRSIEEFEKAVELDPQFAEALLKLAEIIAYYKIWPVRYYSGILDLPSFHHNLERARNMQNLAISRGIESRELKFFIDSLYITSLEDFQKKSAQVLGFYENSGNYEIYRIIGFLNFVKCDYYHAIKYWLRFLELVGSQDTPSVNDLHYLITTLGMAGLTDEAKQLAEEALLQSEDPLRHKYMMIAIMTGKGAEDFIKTVQTFYEENPEDVVFTNMMILAYIFGRDYPKALSLLQKLKDMLSRTGKELPPSMFIAYLFHVLHMKDEMEWHCNKILENSIALSDDVVVPLATFQYTELAGIYALKGQREKMYACLDRIIQQKSVLIDIIIHLKYAPNFDPYQQESEFKSILGTLELRFKSEHERIEELFR